MLEKINSPMSIDMKVYRFNMQKRYTVRGIKMHDNRYMKIITQLFRIYP